MLTDRLLEEMAGDGRAGRADQRLEHAVAVQLDLDIPAQRAIFQQRGDRQLRPDRVALAVEMQGQDPRTVTRTQAQPAHPRRAGLQRKQEPMLRVSGRGADVEHRAHQRAPPSSGLPIRGAPATAASAGSRRILAFSEELEMSSVRGR